ncbi:hypothetical protein Tco_1057299 [Tanacetum coccineum]|uniref:Reverse transcriptase domain-containing protein n=1 Tax=Tanacetum coccineum TaxID=301880 RepID=A0ABQ5H6T1_9ASTR
MKECLALADLGAKHQPNALSIWKEQSLSPIINQNSNDTLNSPTENDFYSNRIAEDFREVEVFLSCRYSRSLITSARSRGSLNLRKTFLRRHCLNRCSRIDEFLERDDSIPPGVDGIYDSEGDTVYLEELLSVINSDPNPPSSPVCEIDVPEKGKSSCEDPPDLELKDLPSHLEYAFLEGDDKLPVIIAKNLKDEDKTKPALEQEILKSHTNVPIDCKDF